MRDRLGVVLRVARDPTLLRIEVAYLGFNMAEFATWIAILVYAYRLGGAGPAAVVALVQLIPAGIVAPFAAYAGDRFRRDRVLVAAYVWQAAAMAATAVAMYVGAPPPVTVAVATTAAVSFTLPRPIHAVILPSITHAPADLTAANAVSGLAENIGVFAGPLLGGALLLRSEPGDVFAAFAAVAVAGTLLVARLPAAFLPAEPAVGGAGEVLAATLGGFRVLLHERRVRLVVMILSAATIVVGALDILFVATAIDLLGLGESWAGYLYAAFGLGGVIGAVASVSLVGRRRLTPSLAATSGLFGLPIAALGIIPAAPSALLLFGLSGAGYGVTTVAGRTLVQRIAPEAVLARVFGVLEGLAMLALAIGSVATGGIVAAFGVGWGLAAAGLLVPVVVAFAWVGIDALDRDARPPDPEALALLRRLPIFAPLSAPSIERILAELSWLEVPAGHALIREGDAGDRFYVISDGRATVTQRGTFLREVGPGDQVGEIALLRGVPRTATVTATTALRLVAIERERFLEAVTGHPVSRATAEAVVVDHLRRSEAG
jgi:MFS family permease